MLLMRAPLIAAVEVARRVIPGLDERWQRFGLRFQDGGELVIIDPRRLGRVSLDPDETALGVDAGVVRLAELRAAQAAASAERFRRAAHSLKSNSHTFGALRLGARPCRRRGHPEHHRSNPIHL